MSAEARLAPTTFYREIARNRRRSWLLVAIVVVVLGVLGGVIGYATGLGWTGVVLAVGAATVLSIGSYFAGDALVMASSGARELDPASPSDRYRQVVNVVEEMRLAGGLPEPLHSMPYALLTAHGRLFAGLADGQLWQSSDQGDSWARCRLEGDELRSINALQAA